jgi:hypothetical protein
LRQIFRHIKSMDNKNENNTAPKGVPRKYIVPPEGSLGLLALGWRGLTQWRAARAASIQHQNKANNEQKG